MRRIKRLFIVLMIALLTMFAIPAGASEVKIPKINGSGYVTYLDDTEYLTINSEYIQKDTDFRAVWISPLVSDIATYQDKAQYQKEILDVFEKMEFYNLNVMVFHVRIMNDALYQSKFSKWSVYYNTNPDWDALPWIIEEAHKRGIEFHAWMNPYRVANGQHDLVELSKKFGASNKASNPDNLLQGQNSVILNPGIPEIKSWLVNVCMEVVENYDVDAIHFDDYFYDYKVDDSKTRAQYNTDNLSLADFRRKQVDDFIYLLQSSIRRYNKLNNKCVQLGISPSGVWNRGDGKVSYDANGNAITNGSYSKTSFIHYGDYLYSDTLKWINNEWIDYILPQCYWSLEHPLCAYADLLEWWDKVVKYKDVNLYSGIGLHQNGGSASSVYSWSSYTEAYHEIMYANKLENVDGVCFFSYKNVEAAVNNPTLMTNVKGIYSTPSILPEVKYGESVVPEKVGDLVVTKNDAGFKLSFDETENTKFYVIYRSEQDVTFSSKEVVDIIGAVKGADGKIEFVDTNVEDGKNYNYGVKAQSITLTLGEGETVSTENCEEGTKAYLGEFNAYLNGVLIKGTTAFVAFDKLSYPFGDSINYKLSYSFDEGAEKTLNTFKTKNGTPYFEIKVPEDANEFNCVVYAYNNIGESTKAISASIGEKLDDVTNFAIIGDYFTGANVEFVWNKHNSLNPSYIIESSTNGFDWSKYIEVTSKGMGINVRQKGKLLDAVGMQYYRVVVTDGALHGYSEVVQISCYNNLGGLTNFKINGEDYKESYTLNEDDKLVLEWNKKSTSQGEVTDIVYFSTDMKNWYVMKMYGQYTSDVVDSKMTYTITISDKAFKVYFKVSSSTDSMKGESQIITVFVNKNNMFSDEVSNYIKEQSMVFTDNLGLFK